MNKAVSFVIAVSLLFSFAGIAFSIDKEKKFKTAAGVIKAIDTKEKTITLQDDKADFTCIFNDKTVFRMSDGKKALTDIKAGDVAAIVKVGYIAALVYEEVNGKNLVKSITVISSAVSSSGEKAKSANSEGKK